MRMLFFAGAKLSIFHRQVEDLLLYFFHDNNRT